MASNGATKAVQKAGEGVDACGLMHPKISLRLLISMQFVCCGSISAPELFLLFQA